jgi:hypothetical protein
MPPCLFLCSPAGAGRERGAVPVRAATSSGTKAATGYCNSADVGVSRLCLHPVGQQLVELRLVRVLVCSTIYFSSIPSFLTLYPGSRHALFTPPPSRLCLRLVFWSGFCCGRGRSPPWYNLKYLEFQPSLPACPPQGFLAQGGTSAAGGTPAPYACYITDGLVINA